MAIVRWDPSRELDSLQSEFNRLFDTFLGNGGRNELRPRRWVPAMDLVETDDHLVLKADLPGMSKEDVDIEVVPTDDPAALWTSGALLVSLDGDALHGDPRLAGAPRHPIALAA